ncbi:3-oxo-5-alpha-steroid 4-dehydrogenase [Mycolicibacter hiberniae]|uniref:Putative steroid dehydrogenase n=1 Tax=Mycolicibacter hiberniae TaxID=29314 RepID=A0A7I7X4K8_9MYCO|nr:3-oxo-5-alpha-steroid 4-dehydrogenase [Mycolicibacter hiberniae]MCV7086032.1 3-oxo-5-alpha-steroid 4-dehydrogenase [Mycolicibacter hiberniae]ORV70599.1 3-oxo-5-alpha-steroid 4-dehydrogenase [Mycolicibacter hiberniae]BBZ24145.1 putative steroid dehydrogenase [Mycolicibacter hiberniae]
MHWYTGNTVYDTVLTAAFGFAAFVIIGGFFGQSSYGRFSSTKLGFNLNPKFGWWLMEIPATVVFAVAYLSGPARFEPTSLVLAGIWALHYANRGWFFPLAIRQVPGKRSTFNVSVVVMGMLVTSMHGYLNGALFSHNYFGQYGTAWLTDPRFLVGLVIYLCGFALLVNSESIVRNLREKNSAGRPAGAEYRIPFGGGFRFVSSPAYLGEIVAWTGFAILTWALPGVAILLITAGNLIPRALGTHRWYQEKFPDYPADRKALVPFLI